MQLASQLSQIVLLIQGETSLDQSFFVKDLRSLEAAQETDCAVLFSRGDNSVFSEIELQKISESKAGVFIVEHELGEKLTERNITNIIMVEDSLTAYGQIAQFYSQKNSEISHEISPDAHIYSDVKIGRDVSIAPGAVIESGAVIGDYAVISAHVYIGKYAQIGSSVKLYPGVKVLDGSEIGDFSIIHAGSIIGSDGFGYQVNKTGLRKIPHTGIVKLGKHVEIGAQCAIDRATFEVTSLDNGTKLDNHVHVAHNVQIGKSCAILAHTSIGGGAVIQDGVQIGGQVVIKDNITIAAGTKIVSKSAVIKDTEPGKTIGGQPAQEFLSWKRREVIINKIVANFDKIKRFIEPESSDSLWASVYQKISKRLQ